MDNSSTQDMSSNNGSFCLNKNMDKAENKESYNWQNASNLIDSSDDDDL